MKVKLDEHQLKAVKHFEGPALVVAGPGSGKTTVIIERILNLIREHNVNPEQILAIAFTNAAIDAMNSRLSCEDVLCNICTLHVFGKEIISANYGLFGFSREPETWGKEEIGEIINREKYLFKRATETTPVVIYKMVGTKGRCYIGQTTNPDRREGEHLTYSSNRRLREAIQKSDEKFKLKQITTVDGELADSIEAKQIRMHRNRAAVILEEVPEEIVNEKPDNGITLYKIKSKSTVTCYFGLTTDIEQSKELHFTESPIDSFRNAIVNEEIDISSFEVIEKGLSFADASIRLEREVLSYKKWAVFNDEDPLHAQDSTRRRIEVFCEYFNVPYDEILEHTQKFEHEMQKFDDLIDDIEKEKLKVKSGRFQPNKIVDPILRAFVTRYEARKGDADAIDLFDMLIDSAYMLEENPKILDEYREKYRFVFVDEFQDISPADFRLIKLFPDNLFAVGDDDQAIYGFRGGNSDIMRNYGDQENIKGYKVTRNYRSTATIVKQAKTLIEHNSERIYKELHAKNSANSRVEVIETSKDSFEKVRSNKDTVEEVLHNELLPLITVCETHFKDNIPYLDNVLLKELTTPQQIGILARNWYEVNPIKSFLIRTLLHKGFQNDKDSQEHLMDSDNLEKRKLILRRGQKRIEVSTIHSAKGQEWDKVILLVNTMSDSINPKPSLPDDRNSLTDERRLFYVAVTRAKNELVILYGGYCQFVSEFQELPHSERKKQLEMTHRSLISVFKNRVSNAKLKLEKASQSLLGIIKSQRHKLLETSIKSIRKKYEPEFDQVRRSITEIDHEIKEIKFANTEKFKTTENTLLKMLIPIYDQLDSSVKNISETAKPKDLSFELETFSEHIHSAQGQFLDLIKNHGVKRIITHGRPLNPDQHEEILPRMYSKEVPIVNVIKELYPGYLLHDQVIQKAKVTVSKGERHSDWLSILDLNQSIYFVTDQDDYSLRNIKVISEIIIGLDSQGLAVQMAKNTVLFVFEKRNLDVVKPEQQDVEPISERISISDEFLRTIFDKKGAADLKFILKAGYVLRGQLHSFDKEVLYIVINKKIVVLFRHGILSILNELEIKSTQVENPINPVDEKINGSKTHDWSKIMKAYANGTPVNGKIISYIEGGFRVRIGLLQGFLPASEVDLLASHELDTFIGKILEMKITHFNQQQENLVLSCRALFSKKSRNKFLESIEIGQVVNGIVKNITHFGVFVDLGTIDGLIHKTEISWKPINHPSEVISIGDEVEVKVIKINREEEKVSLSLKQMKSDPWENVEEKYKIGSTVHGVVINIVDYGAFLQLEEGVVGLLHISEMSNIDNGKVVANLFNKGDEVEVVVLEVSKDSKRISLSMKQTQDNKLKLLVEKYSDKSEN